MGGRRQTRSGGNKAVLALVVAGVCICIEVAKFGKGTGTIKARAGCGVEVVAINNGDGKKQERK